VDTAALSALHLAVELYNTDTDTDPVATAAAAVGVGVADVWALVVERCDDQIAGVRVAALTRAASTPVTVAEQVLAAGDTRARIDAAAHPGLDPVTVAEVVATSDCSIFGPSLGATALANPACPFAVLHQATRGGISERRAVATNPACPSLLLERLARDVFDDVRSAVADNPACPDKVLAQLRGDVDGWVRERAAVATRRRDEHRATAHAG
jgi:hypothetical protein